MSRHQSHSRGPWIALIAGIVAIILVVVAWVMVAHKRDTPLFGSRSGQQYTVGLTDQPSSLDIRVTDQRSAKQILIGNVYETLVTLDDETGIKANLAARWLQSDDGLHYTFYLRNNLRFADGSTLNASSVVSSLHYTITHNHDLAEELGDITRVENPDDSTITIELSKPNPRLLVALAGRAGVITNTAAENPDYEQHSYGSGPFEISAVHDSSLELTRNDQYWGEQANARSITVHYYADDTALADAMRAGDLDVAMPSSAAGAEQLRAQEHVTVSDGMSTKKVLVALNNRNESPFSDEQVRQFTRYAINAAEIAKTQPDAQAQLSGPISQMQPGYTDLNDLYPFDLAKAQSMRGYFFSNYFNEFALLTDEAHQALAETIAEQMSAIPMPVHVEVLDTETLNDRVQQGDYDAALIVMSEPNDYVNFVNGSPMFAYQNGQVQDAYNQALACTDYASYREKLREFDRLVSEDAASAWLYTAKDVVAYRDGMSGIQANLASQHLLLNQLKG